MLLAWGQGQDAPEASAGICLVMVNSLDFRRRRREALAPALSAEKLVPYGSKRTGLAPRPWAPGQLGRTFFPLTFVTPRSLNCYRSPCILIGAYDILHLWRKAPFSPG